MKAEADVGVVWWVWPCGCRMVGVGIVWVCEMGLAALAWWRRHGVGNSKISSSHLAFWQLHSRRGQQQSLSPLTVFFFFFLKSLSLSLSCLSLRFSFLFFSFGFPFGLRRLESSVGLLGLHFWTKIFFFFFFLMWAGQLG